MTDSQARAGDEELVRRVARQDREAFAELYQRYNRPLLTYLSRLVGDQAVAEEIFQDVLLIVWQDAGRYGGRSSLRTWLYRVAHYQAVDWLRKRRPETLDELLAQPAGDPEPEPAAIESAQREQLAVALRALSADHRAVIELAFFHEMSYREIAQVVGCPVGTVKSRMSHARRQLAGALLRLQSGV